MSTDEHIMSLVSKGDISQAGTLFERYQVAMYNYFRKMNNDQSLSEDLTQEVFKRLISYRTTFEGKHSFKGWLYRIASNVRNDHYRQQKIKLSDGNHIPEMATDNRNIIAEQIEESRKLQQAISSLKEDHREILVMTKLQKMKYSEVAKMNNTTETNVKTIVHRSIVNLRKYYQKNNWL